MKTPSWFSTQPVILVTVLLIVTSKFEQKTGCLATLEEAFSKGTKAIIVSEYPTELPESEKNSKTPSKVWIKAVEKSLSKQDSDSESLSVESEEIEKLEAVPKKSRRRRGTKNRKDDSPKKSKHRKEQQSGTDEATESSEVDERNKKRNRAKVNTNKQKTGTSCNSCLNFNFPIGVNPAD